jgi:hypothetical protein
MSLHMLLMMQGVAGGSGVALLSAQRWRIFMSEPLSGIYMGLCGEAEFRKKKGGPNKATGGTPSADSEFNDSTWAMLNLFDGDSETCWLTEASNFPSWVEYDFLEEVQIVQILLTASVANPERAPKNIKIQAYVNDAWQTVFDEDQAAWSSGESRTFDVVQPEWVNPGQFVYELEVYTITGAPTELVAVQQLEVYTITGAPTAEVAVFELEVYTIVEV